MVSKIVVALFLILLLFPAPVFSFEKKVVVYSSRKWQQMASLLKEYSSRSGVRVIYVAGKAGNMFERLKAEGEATPADIYYTIDAGYLWQADEAELLQPVDSPILEANIPDEYQAPDNTWFGLSLRPRVIVYNSSTDAAEKLRSYEELATEKWKGRLVLCASMGIYSQSFVASLIAQHGEQKAKEIVSGWVQNQVVNPFSTDQTALEAIAAGIGDVTMVSFNYFARFMKIRPESPLAVFWPNQDADGVHVDISGAGVIRGSMHRAEAIKLLEWLSGKKAQQLLAHEIMEFPANPQVSLIPNYKQWGPFKINTMNIGQYGKLQGDALEIMKAAKYR